MAYGTFVGLALAVAFPVVRYFVLPRNAAASPVDRAVGMVTGFVLQYKTRIFYKKLT